MAGSGGDSTALPFDKVVDLLIVVTPKVKFPDALFPVLVTAEYVDVTDVICGTF